VAGTEINFHLMFMISGSNSDFQILHTVLYLLRALFQKARRISTYSHGLTCWSCIVDQIILDTCGLCKFFEIASEITFHSLSLSSLIATSQWNLKHASFFFKWKSRMARMEGFVSENYGSWLKTLTSFKQSPPQFNVYYQHPFLQIYSLYRNHRGWWFGRMPILATTGG
jgi:hypothetical protein